MLTFATTPTTLADVARKELGTAESPAGSNKIKYNAWAGLQGEPWCATFVRWCLAQCGVKAPFSSYVPNIKSVAKKNDCWVDGSQLPEVGDIVCFGFPGEDHSPNHTGIVVGVSGIRDIQTIEGNTDVAGGRTGGQVMRKRRTADIDGYLRPTYMASAGNGEDMTQEQFDAIIAHIDTRVNTAVDAAINRLEKDIKAVSGVSPADLKTAVAAAFKDAFA